MIYRSEYDTMTQTYVLFADLRPEQEEIARGKLTSEGKGTEKYSKMQIFVNFTHRQLCPLHCFLHRKYYNSKAINIKSILRTHFY